MQIELWENDRKRCPVGEFISSINDKKIQKKILWAIDLLEEKGLLLIHTPYLLKINHKTEALYELRIKFSNNIFRILLIVINEVAWLLNGFTKKSNETPPNEITIAIERAQILKSNLNII
jgi:phage-related protein